MKGRFAVVDRDRAQNQIRRGDQLPAGRKRTPLAVQRQRFPRVAFEGLVVPALSFVEQARGPQGIAMHRQRGRMLRIAGRHHCPHPGGFREQTHPQQRLDLAGAGLNPRPGAFAPSGGVVRVKRFLIPPCGKHLVTTCQLGFG